jgi:hypothetical protein
VAMLAELVDGVIGVDTHRDTVTAAAVSHLGGVLARTTTSADAAGYRQLLGFAHRHLPGRRCWAVEGLAASVPALPGSCTSTANASWRSADTKRLAHRSGAKSDALDAVRAAREALGQDHLAIPRCRGQWEALRVLLTTRRCAILARVAAIGQPRGADRGRPRGAARRAARPQHQRSDPALRQPAATAHQVAGAPSHRAGTAGHRPAHPIPASRGRPAAGRAHQAGRRGRALAAGGSRGRPPERRAGAGQLVARRTPPFRGRLCRPGRHQPNPRLLRPGDPLPPQPRRRPPAQPRAAPSCWCACAPIPTPAPTWPAAPPREKAAATPSGASGASSLASCSGCWSATTDPASKSSGQVDST